MRKVSCILLTVILVVISLSGCGVPPQALQDKEDLSIFDTVFTFGDDTVQEGETVIFAMKFDVKANNGKIIAQAEAKMFGGDKFIMYIVPKARYDHYMVTGTIQTLGSQYARKSILCGNGKESLTWTMNTSLIQEHQMYLLIVYQNNYGFPHNSYDGNLSFRFVNYLPKEYN